MAIGDRSEQEVSYEEKLRTDNRAIAYAYIAGARCTNFGTRSKEITSCILQI